MTSIEWLKDYMQKMQYFIGNDLLEAFEQAKEMHKQEMAETFKQSRQALIFEKDMPPVYENFEEYYQETFVSKRNDDKFDMLKEMLELEFPKQENHIVDTNEMVDQVAYVRKTVEDDGLQYIRIQMEKAECYKLGYNRAKETLYTEEQVMDAIYMAREISKHSSYMYTEKEIIQSLKQPKKD